MRTGAIVCGLLALALCLCFAAGAEAAKKPPTNDFILRAPAEAIDDIAFRHGLEILDEVGSSTDALGRQVYLVRAPLGVSPDEVLREIAELEEPEALKIEEVFLALLPELGQSTMALLDAEPVLAASRTRGPRTARTWLARWRSVRAPT